MTGLITIPTVNEFSARQAYYDILDKVHSDGVTTLYLFKVTTTWFVSGPTRTIFACIWRTPGERKGPHRHSFSFVGTACSAIATWGVRPRLPYVRLYVAYFSTTLCSFVPTHRYDRSFTAVAVMLALGTIAHTRVMPPSAPLRSSIAAGKLHFSLSRTYTLLPCSLRIIWRRFSFAGPTKSDAPAGFTGHIIRHRRCERLER